MEYKIEEKGVKVKQKREVLTNHLNRDNKIKRIWVQFNSEKKM